MVMVNAQNAIKTLPQKKAVSVTMVGKEQTALAKVTKGFAETNAPIKFAWTKEPVPAKRRINKNVIANQDTLASTVNAKRPILPTANPFCPV